jgi:oligopeptide/dipeptide ABC transporter ATP-binding protein
MRSIPRLDDPSHTRLRVIIGRPPNLLAPPPGCSFSPRCPYAQDRCRVEEPQLESFGDAGHRFACFYPLGTPENKAALQRNLDAGLPQSIAMLDVPGGGLIDPDPLPAGTTNVNGQAGGEEPKNEVQLSAPFGNGQRTTDHEPS